MCLNPIGNAAATFKQISGAQLFQPKPGGLRQSNVDPMFQLNSV